MPLVLPDLNVAIAEGAARFAALPDDSRERIRGGYPHGVYVELQRDDAEAAARLVCVLPQDFEAGARVKLAAPTFELIVNRPVRFAAYTSNRRAQDAPGDLVALDPQAFHPLPPLQTTIVHDDERLQARARPRRAASPSNSRHGITELGMLAARPHRPRVGSARWNLEFNLRQPVDSRPRPNRASGTRPGVGAKALAAAQARIALFFGGGQSLDASLKVKALPRELERILGQERHRWNVPLLRSLWPAIHPGITRRGRSLDARKRVALSGRLRVAPGLWNGSRRTGRVMQLWECFDLGLVHRRRRARAVELVDDVAPHRWRHTGAGTGATVRSRPAPAQAPGGEFVEGTRLLGSLERVRSIARLELARWLFDLRPAPARRRARRTSPGRSPGCSAECRSTRPPRRVVPASVVEEVLRARRGTRLEAARSASAASRCSRPRAGAPTSDSLDIDDGVRRRVLDKLARSGATQEQMRCVREAVPVTGAQRSQLFGEQLPAGLRLSAA